MAVLPNSGKLIQVCASVYCVCLCARVRPATPPSSPLLFTLMQTGRHINKYTQNIYVLQEVGHMEMVQS